MKVSLQQLSKIFSVAFDERITINSSSSKENMVQWDSLKHLYLILELEDHLNVKFTTTEIEQIKNVEQLLIILEKNKPWI